MIMGKEDKLKPAEMYEPDLHPDDRAGQNQPRDDATVSAFDLKDVHDRLGDLPDDVLKQIPVLRTGTRLDEGATYIDLAQSDPQEFTGMNNLVAEPHNCYVDKSMVDYELWNRLIGVDDPYRLGRFAA
jgi:hypothetical protein